MAIFSIDSTLDGYLFDRSHLSSQDSLDHLHGDKYNDAKAQDDLDIRGRGFDDPEGLTYRWDLNEHPCQYDLRYNSKDKPHVGG